MARLSSRFLAITPPFSRSNSTLFNLSTPRPRHLDLERVSQNWNINSRHCCPAGFPICNHVARDRGLKGTKPDGKFLLGTPSRAKRGGCGGSLEDEFCPNEKRLNYD